MGERQILDKVLDALNLAIVAEIDASFTWRQAATLVIHLHALEDKANLCQARVIELEKKVLKHGKTIVELNKVLDRIRDQCDHGVVSPDKILNLIDGGSDD